MKITARVLVSYAAAIGALVCSGVALVLEPLAGVALFAGGIFCLPPTRRCVAETTDLRFSSTAVVLIAVVLLLGGLGGAAAGQLTDSPRVQYEYEWEVVAGQGFDPRVVVTGTAENVGDAAAGDVVVEAQLLDGNGDQITERQKTLDTTPPGTTQMFYFKTDVTGAEASRIQDVNVTVSITR
jgi:hypothetical protein